MTRAPTTGRSLYHALRRGDIVLAANGDRLAFDCPVGVMTPERLTEIKARKPELLAVVRGDYLHAALALVLDEPDRCRQEDLAEFFDERAGIGEYDAGMDRYTAERFAYIHLCRAVEGGTI
jgi:hypothetical protein